MVGIAKREIDPRLQKLFDDKKNVYSISKLNCISSCLFEAYKTYVLHEKGTNNIYGCLGTRVHDTLECIMTQTKTEADLLPAMEAEFEDMTIIGLEFPKDFKGNDTIKNNWIADMTHFCTNFIKPKGKFSTEEFILYKINDNRYVQGYVDLIKHNRDKTISIYDWKSSSDFDAEHLLEAGRQLVFYAMAKEQEGFVVKEVAWIMLKYCEVMFEGRVRINSKNKTQMIKVVNRGKLLSTLRPYIEADLNDMDFDELEIEMMLNNAVKQNSFDVLPQELSQRYVVKPYVRKYEITDELRQETLDYINAIADLFESKTKDEKDWTPRKFIKKSKTGKESDDTFKCNVLCNHRNSCIHIKRYNEVRSLTKVNDGDLF